MSVIINPAKQLEFHRPLTHIQKVSLFVKNPSSTPVIFKVKRTAPKLYSSKPGNGRIEGNSEIEIQFILQGFKDEPAEDFKCKDKFLIQTADIPKSLEQLDILAMWSHVEINASESIHSHMLECVFLPAKSEDDRLMMVNNDVEEENQIPPPVSEKKNEHEELEAANETIKLLQRQLDGLQLKIDLMEKEQIRKDEENKQLIEGLAKLKAQLDGSINNDLNYDSYDEYSDAENDINYDSE